VCDGRHAEFFCCQLLLGVGSAHAGSVCGSEHPRARDTPNILENQREEVVAVSARLSIGECTMDGIVGNLLRGALVDSASRPHAAHFFQKGKEIKRKSFAFWTMRLFLAFASLAVLALADPPRPLKGSTRKAYDADHRGALAGAFFRQYLQRQNNNNNKEKKTPKDDDSTQLREFIAKHGGSEISVEDLLGLLGEDSPLSQQIKEQLQEELLNEMDSDVVEDVLWDVIGSAAPSDVPSEAPSAVPSDAPSMMPSDTPSMTPRTWEDFLPGADAIPEGFERCDGTGTLDYAADEEMTVYYGYKLTIEESMKEQMQSIMPVLVAIENYLSTTLLGVVCHFEEFLALSAMPLDIPGGEPCLLNGGILYLSNLAKPGLTVVVALPLLLQLFVYKQRQKRRFPIAMWWLDG
jgi:hypothetical protein